ncbi:MAG: glycosyltransferase [Planctomycetota bacterium]
MHVSGFTIARNIVRFDYPSCESIRSLLPLVDEMVVAVGRSSDATRDTIQAIGDPKIRIIDTVWDDSNREGGTVLADQTNIALDACQGDWCFYLQADEVIHENEIDRIYHSMRRNLNDKSIDALSFNYHHFFADYGIRDTLSYRRQNRIVRPGRGIRSVGDACGFGLSDRRLRWVATGGWIYHYGHVKSPAFMNAKMEYFNSLYDGRTVDPATVNAEEKAAAEYMWNLSTCEPFTGTHPAVMQDRIAAKDWETPDVALVPMWRNPAYYRRFLYKNTRALRRLFGRKAA